MSKIGTLCLCVSESFYNIIFLHYLQSNKIMLAGANNIVLFRETDSVIIMRFSALIIYVNRQRTAVNSPWVSITIAQFLLSLGWKNPVEKVCCPLTVVC